ncbi:hypothetical protein DHEL01_v209917 [Diaporthe helianthi]|uniref:Rhodopsin domain-containing protein n=1 Tax=Diaporthe helianthi TaxID=158607 RepID=A0A2P5HN38_DIAHE|nr:hypothetical protein DHEL01_v209917 [Diaporthe helianthi]
MMMALDANSIRTLTDHRIQLEAVYWSFVVISTIFVALRIWARLSRRMLGVDDWLMVACWLSFAATGVLVTLIAESGGTRHKAAAAPLAASEELLGYQMKLQTINLVFRTATTLFGKMAIALAILRIVHKVNNRRQTWPVYIVVHLMNATCILDTLLILLRCGSPENLWNDNDTARGQSPTRSCMDEGAVHKFHTAAAAFQVFVDLFLAFFPMHIIWGLQMPSHRKYTIMTLLGLTTLTGLAALAKMAVSQAILGDTAPDSAGDMFILSVCTAAQIMLLIVCGSVPTMVPLWNDLVKSRHQADGSAGGGGTTGGKESKNRWPREAERPQTRLSIEKAELGDLDEEESRAVTDSPKTGAVELPSPSHAREPLGYPSASKQGMFNRLSGRWHLGEKRWGRVEDEGASERRFSDSAL